MPAYLRLPWSVHPDREMPLEGFSSLADLQQEKWERYKRNAPPHEFDPAWMIEATIAKNIDDGVELWKWSIDRHEWKLDAVIVWREGN